MEGPSGFGGRMPRGEGLAKKKGCGTRPLDDGATRWCFQIPDAGEMEGLESIACAMDPEDGDREHPAQVTESACACSYYSSTQVQKTCSFWL